MRTRTVLAAMAAAMAGAAAQASSITIDGVAQRWPWNNKVDITYTVAGGQDVAAGVYAKVVFTATIDGTEYTIDGVHDVGASASDGQHTVTWTPPADLRVKATGCTMTATLSAANDPSGNDYMVIDLSSGEVSYEGLLATQDASNERYKAAVYKTDKLVLRRVPRWAERAALPNAAALPTNGYPTGDDTNYKNANSATTWATDRDYYIGVFPVTQGQYTKIGLTNPSKYTTDITDNVTAHRPAEQVSWDALRVAGTAPTESVPAISSDTGTFLQRLNYRTGRYFDLPTEVMFEIAERAGATTVFWWGDSFNADYVVYSEDSSNERSSTVAVGSRKPNAWGLYDTAGNVWEWCLDDRNALANLADATDVFTPAWANNTRRIYRGGGDFSNGVTRDSKFHASYRDGNNSPNTSRSYIGFRVAYIAE